jgi:hypothetical protein
MGNFGSIMGTSKRICEDFFFTLVSFGLSELGVFPSENILQHIYFVFLKAYKREAVLIIFLQMRKIVIPLRRRKRI